jgi:hypothetical protein
MAQDRNLPSNRDSFIRLEVEICVQVPLKIFDGPTFGAFKGKYRPNGSLTEAARQIEQISRLAQAR